MRQHDEGVRGRRQLALRGSEGALPGARSGVGAPRSAHASPAGVRRARRSRRWCARGSAASRGDGHAATSPPRSCPLLAPRSVHRGANRARDRSSHLLLGRPASRGVRGAPWRIVALVEAPAPSPAHRGAGAPHTERAVMPNRGAPAPQHLYARSVCSLKRGAPILGKRDSRKCLKKSSVVRITIIDTLDSTSGVLERGGGR